MNNSPYVLILDKKVFPDKARAKAKVEAKGFDSSKLIDSNNAFRFRQAESESFKQDSFRIKNISNGFTSVIGEPI